MRSGYPRRPTLGALARAIALLVLSATAVSADGAILVVDRYRVTPDAVEIEVGEEVTFRVAETESLVDGVKPIRIVIEGLVRSPQLEPGERWPFTFTRSGFYDLHIEAHPGSRRRRGRPMTARALPRPAC